MPKPGDAGGIGNGLHQVHGLVDGGFVAELDAVARQRGDRPGNAPSPNQCADGQQDEDGPHRRTDAVDSCL